MSSLESCLSVARDSGSPKDQAARFLRSGYVPLPWHWKFHAAAREADREDGPVLIGCGGARGPGKTHGIFCQGCLDDSQRVPGLKGLFLRKTAKASKESLDDLVLKVLTGKVPHEYSSSVIRFANGSRVIVGGFKDDGDIDKYVGQEYDWIAVEELNQLTEEKVLMLRGSLRTSKGGWRTRLYTSFNPGGIGHAFVKETFVEPYRAKQETETRFFPSTYRDNPYLSPEYVSYLESLEGQLGEAWREGNFDIFAGQFFMVWDPDKHLIDPVEIPSYWLRFRSMDWGSAAPAAVYWFAVSDGYYPHIPRGALVVYREWYVAQKLDTGWVGLKFTAEQLAEGVAQREAGEKIAYGVAGQDTFDHRGGPSIAERMSSGGVHWHEADNRRVPGWDQMAQRLRGLDRPMLYFFRSCVHAARTIPAMVHDETNLEDIDDNLEDHAPESIRYGCMSRPWEAIPVVKTPEFRTTFKSLVKPRTGRIQ